ncbi:hypothetical protein DV736_g4483, partial [Chaetothyriales sp. CBS 134916]
MFPPLAEQHPQPLPIVLCATNPHHFTYVIDQIKPSVEVLAVFTSVSTATTELPLLLSGHPALPSSGYGSLSQQSIEPPSMPRAIVVGGGFSDDDYSRIKQAAELSLPQALLNDEVTGSGGGEGEGITWFRPNPSNRAWTGLPKREELAARMKAALGKWVDEQAEAEAKGEASLLTAAESLSSIVVWLSVSMATTSIPLLGNNSTSTQASVEATAARGAISVSITGSSDELSANTVACAFVG